MPKPPRFTCWLNQNHVAELRSVMSSSEPLETGGLLLGYWADASNIVVTQMTTAGPKAKHLLTSYLPDDEYDRQAVEQIYGRSRGIETYLGDWHTHPGGICRLSSTDRAVLRLVAFDDLAANPRPIMAIFSGRGSRWNVACWCKSRRTMRFPSGIRQTEVSWY